MADPNAPAAENPFDQIDLNLAPQTLAPPAAPANQNEAPKPAAANPFDAVDLDLAPATSATGSFLHPFERGLAPMAGGMAAVGTGAEIGAAGGGFVAGPPGAAIGGFAGGLLGMIGGATAVNAAQDWALSKLPDSWVEAIGQSDRQRKLEEEQHPTASFLGGLAPYALTMSPGGLAKSAMKLPANATALQRIMANPITARVFGGGLVGGMEAGQELAQGQHPDWSHVAIATGLGIVFNKPTRIGQTLTEIGAAPVRTLFGVPKIEAPSPVLTPEAVPQAGTAGVTESTEIAPPIAPTAQLQKVEPEPAPTIAAAADTKVMGPGITESVYHGTQRQSPESEATAQQTRRTEMLATEPPPEPDLHAIARRMEPELFTRYYDELSAQREAFRSAIRDASNPPEEELQAARDRQQALQAQLDAHLADQSGYTGGPEARRLRAQVRDAASQLAAIEERRNAFAEGRAQDTPDIAAARQHLLAVDFEMRDLATQVSAAYRRAADAVGAGTVPHEPEVVAPPAPAPAAVEPAQPIPGVPAVPPPVPPALPVPIADQLSMIANDVMQQLVNAGRSPEEALASGQLVASRYKTRAARFGGKLGSPLEIYRREGADNRPGREKATPAPAPAPADAVKELAQNTPAEFDQTARGKIRLSEGARPIITLMKDANASTFIHETGHQWLEELTRDAAHEAAPAGLKADMQTVRDWLGVKADTDIKTRQHEKFARGFEQYMREGVAPSPGLASVFAKFRNWLTSIYQTLKGLGTPISEDIRSVFDRLIESEPERTVIAPDRPDVQTMADLHAADAAAIEPHEAEPARDRIIAEANRFVEELPPEIQHEIIQAEAEARAGSPAAAEPGGKGGDGSAVAEQVDANRGKSESIPTGGNGGEDAAKVQPGGGEAWGKGAGISGGAGDKAEGAADAAFESEQRRGLDGGSGVQQLAPGPSDLFGTTDSRFVDKAGNIRLENLTTNEDVKQAIRDAADANNDFISHRRGVITDGQMMDLAADIGMDGAWDLVKKHVIGQGFSAEEIVALRMALVQSAANVAAAAKKAAGGLPEDVIAYAAATQQNMMIQGTVAAATAEWGRAGHAFRELNKLRRAQSAEMSGDGSVSDHALRAATGKTMFQLVQQARLAANLDTPGKISKFLRDAQKRSFGRMILEYWINGLISGPTTHATYVVGNTLFAVHKAVPETLAASLVGRVAQALGREGERVRLGEVGAQLGGAVRGLPGAIESSSEAFRSGRITQLPGEKAHVLTPFEGDTQIFHGKTATNDPVTWHEAAAGMYGVIRGLRDGILAIGTLAKGGEPGSPLVGLQYKPGGQIPDIALRGVNVLPIGSLARMPGRFVGTIDSFFRSAVYSMEKNAEAYRTATNEGLIGTAHAQRMADIRQNPSEALMERARGEATAVALMTHSGPFMQKLSNLINTEIPLPIFGRTPLLKFVDPFVRVAGNVMDQSVMRRSPLGLLSSELRADVMGKNGNIAQDKAIGRMLVGTALAVTWGGLRAQGVVTGSAPADRRERLLWERDNQAHSVRIGNMWFDVHRLEPMSMLMGIAADLYDVAETADQGEYAKAAAELHHAIVQNLLDESFMRGPAELMRAIEDHDRYGAQYVRNFASSFIPYSVGMSQITRAMDPYTRQARTTVDAMKAKLPWMSQELMPRRDIWGEPIPNKDALGPSGMTSIYEQNVTNDPVNAALRDLHIYPAPPDRTILNVKLNDQQYDDYSRLAGRMMKQRLDVFVNSPDFRTWPIEGKIYTIDGIIQHSREAARGVMQAKYPSIPVEAHRLKVMKSRGETE